jgi:DNA-binding MarR family transcriptional regulator
MPLTISQFHLLKLMLVDGKHQVGKVADFLGVSAPAATKSVDKLERLDLVVRSPSKGDRRATLLSVSPKGRRLVRKYEELKAERLAPILGRFKPEEVESLTELLERFAVSLLEQEEGDNEFCLHCAGYLTEGCSVGLTRGGCPHEKGRTGITGDEGAKGNS